MSNFPNNFDDDTTLPFVNDNITEIGGDAINALREAVFQIQQYLGLGGDGTTNSISARFGVSIQPDGYIKPSAITGLGLVTLPITGSQIANYAEIPESKLHLDYRTQDLYNYIRDLASDVNLSVGWIATTGIKLEPHLMGAIYRHTMDQVDVAVDSANFLKNNKRTLRDNLSSYTLVKDMNAEFLAHQWADGSPFGSPYNITTNNGSLYSSIYGHTGSGIFINTSRFNNIPQTADDLQLFAEYIDSASILVLGTRIQNLYTNGISKVSRSSSLTTDGYGQSIIPPTPAIAFLKNIGNSSSPYDNIDSGDDIIEFKPSAGEQTSHRFDAKFALVKIGDIIRINYGSIEVPYLIKEKKYSGTIGSKKYVVRIAGKNQFYTTTAIARIDKPLANGNKFGELSISPVNNKFSATPSLIINNPRGAQATGIGFNPEQFDEKHYLLYLALYSTGHAADGYTILPAIDVTGNQGTTPGAYTLESIVQATNNAFRAAGFNYRFTAFSYQGEFGICLAESYHNAAFSILSAAFKADGSIDTLATSLAFPNSVIDLQPAVGTLGLDPLGFGLGGSNIASPPFYSSYGSAAASQYPTKLLVPLRRNTYYVDGAEKERLNRDPSQALDGYGDGYWVGTIQDVTVLSGHVQTTYRIPLDLSTSGLKIGKTIVAQSLGAGTLNDFGRYIIQNVVFGCSPANYTDVTVYDSVHAVGTSPSTVLQPYSQVALYFGSDSVSFNTESATDFDVTNPFKRYFEVYVDFDGNSFTHERTRINISGSTQTINTVSLYGNSDLAKLDIIKVSPKLRGFQFGTVNKITLRMFNYNSTTNIFDGYLCSYDGTNYTHYGPRTTGRKGAITRFYDETNVDYIDILFDINTVISDVTDQLVDFQLFPSLMLDDHLMLLGTCQVNDTSHIVSRILDSRQFGNISEKDLSTSVLDYMSVPEKHLHTNGVVRGFDIYQNLSGPNANVYLTGGIALVNGKFVTINNDVVTIPALRELYQSTLYKIEWAICVNDLSEYKLIPLLESLGSSLPPNRLFIAKDLVSNTTYELTAYTFSDLVNNVKNLTPLYVATSTASTTPSVSVAIKDARKYIHKKDWGQVPTLTTGIDEGDFKTWEALETWLNRNGQYDSEVSLKGNFTNVPNSLEYYNADDNTSRVKFNGNYLSTLNISTNTDMKNVDLININISVSLASAFMSIVRNNWTNVTFSGKPDMTVNSGSYKDCNFTLTQDGSGVAEVTFYDCVIDNTTFNLNGATVIFNNCKVSNCTFNSISGDVNTLTATTTSVQKNSIFDSNIFSFSTLTALTLRGIIHNNQFNWLHDSYIILNSVIDICNNTFYTNNNVLSEQFLNIQDGTNGTISSNKFFRNNNNLSYGYIKAPSSYTNGMVSVVGNYFDSPTFDGTNQNLVFGCPIDWIYKNNINAPITVNMRFIDSIDTSIYDVGPIDDMLIISSGEGIIVNLPLISNTPRGRKITIKRINSSPTGIITIKAAGSDLIEDMSTSVYEYNVPYGSITIVANNVTVFDDSGDLFMWHII